MAKAIVVQEDPEPVMKWFWFSFLRDPDVFIGGLIVDGESFTDAHRNTHRRGINPGGEVKAMELVDCNGPDDLSPYVPYRLYTKAEMESIDGASRF